MSIVDLVYKPLAVFVSLLLALFGVSATPKTPGGAVNADPRLQTYVPFDTRVVLDYLFHTPEEELSAETLGDLITEELFAEDFRVVLCQNPRVAFVYNAATKTVTGITDEGILGLGFEYDESKQYFYPSQNPFFLGAGFNAFYDWFGNTTTAFELETRRIRFNHNNRDWQVQLWKGKYFFSAVMGGELGFYVKPESRQAHHYDPLPREEAMPISLKMYSAEHEYFNLPAEERWWAVMLRYRKPITDPAHLTEEGTITFRDPGLQEAFTRALAEQHPDIEQSTDGATLWFRWNATA
jgi:hypothetical protein